jgi:hypothetical protein
LPPDFLADRPILEKLKVKGTGPSLMAKQLRDKLQDLAGSATGVVGWIGLGTLLVVALTLPSDLSLESLAKYGRQLPSFSDALQQFSKKIPALLLALATIFWYLQYKSAVFVELDLIDSMFSEKSKPKYYGNLIGHREFSFLGYILVLTFAILIVSVTHIEIFCIVALMLHTSDLIGNGLVLQNINRAIARFKIIEDSEAPFVRARREIMLAYYFDNPTLGRICVTTVTTVVALVVAVRTDESSPYGLFYLPYALMIINILLSEAIMKIWRRRRDKALDDIAKQEDENPSLPASTTPS